MRFAVSNLPLVGLKLLERKPICDSRGSLTRIFCRDELKSAGWQESIAQINLTQTLDSGTVRGMHFQYPPYTEFKLVSCIKGEVWDIVVDLRAKSTTFLETHVERLSAKNNLAILIPPGFAHGFQSLTDNAELLYLHSTPHNIAAEGGLNPLDPMLKLFWPLPITRISERDKSHPMLDKNFKGIYL